MNTHTEHLPPHLATGGSTDRREHSECPLLPMLIPHPHLWARQLKRKHSLNPYTNAQISKTLVFHLKN